MPTGLSIALRFLYAFLLVGLCCVGVLGQTAQWLDAKFGVWIMWGCIAAYAGIMAGVVALINKINRDWPTFDPPPAIKAPQWRVGQLLSFQRQSAQSAKPLPIERLPEPEKSAETNI